MQPDDDQADYTRFLRGVSRPEFVETDNCCVTSDVRNNTTCLRQILPLYYHLTRSRKRLAVAKLKKLFGCGAELIARVKYAIAQKKPIPIPRKGRRNIRNNNILRGLIDATTMENGHISDSELSSMLGTSRNTVNRIRHDLNFRYKALRHGPALSPRQIRARLDFCLNNLFREWTIVLFTDESRFSTSPDSPVMWWIKRGHSVYIESQKFPPSIMVWGGILGPQKTPLVLCPQRLNAHEYVELLEQNGVDAFMRACGQNAVFQQDGARCHTAVSTMRWLQSREVECLRAWPPNSPDLSPVEQVWGIMKRYIIQRFGMKSPLTIQQLNEAVFEAYNTIHWRTVGILTLSAKYRMQLCVERQGKFIGDMIGECCRRAKVELESENDIQLLSVSLNIDDERDAQSTHDHPGSRLGQTTRPAQRAQLPSFRSGNTLLPTNHSIH